MAAITYKCPKCGGDLRFQPAGQRFVCEYCDSEYSQKELEETAVEAETAEPEQEECPDAVCYICPSCGAEIVTDETTAATFCYYCHNPVMLEGRMRGSFHPDLVIPDRKSVV